MDEDIRSYDEIVAEGRAFRKKVNDMFAELVGPRAQNLNGHPDAVLQKIKTALQERGEPEKLAFDMAFHLCDWNYDAAFLVALLLFPERFSSNEITKGIDAMLCHAPAHILAAARLNGESTDDFFAEEEKPE